MYTFDLNFINKMAIGIAFVAGLLLIFLISNLGDR